MIPPGGWSFEQVVENSTPFKIEGQTYAQLEDKVFSFRLANVELIPSGTATRESVRSDIRAFICPRFPTQCSDDWGIPLPKETPSQVTGTVYRMPIQRLEDWIKKLAFSEIQFNDASSAAVRASTCAECPQNIGWKTSCAPCVGSVSTRIARYKGDRHTPLDSKLQACRVFGHHNELAVWMSDTLSTANDTPPPECWNQ